MLSCRQLRARRALLQLKDVPLRTRRALLQYKVYDDSAFWLSMQHLWSAITPFWLSTCVYVHAYLRVCQYFFSMYRCIWMYFSSCVCKLKMTHSIYPMMHGWDHLWTRKPRPLVQSHPSIIVITPAHCPFFPISSHLGYTLLALFTNIYKQGEIFKYF